MMLFVCCVPKKNSNSFQDEIHKDKKRKIDVHSPLSVFIIRGYEMKLAPCNAVTVRSDDFGNDLRVAKGCGKYLLWDLANHDTISALRFEDEQICQVANKIQLSFVTLPWGKTTISKKSIVSVSKAWDRSKREEVYSIVFRKMRGHER